MGVIRLVFFAGDTYAEAPFAGVAGMTPPNYSLLVDGVDLTEYVVQDHWTVTQNFGRQGDTATFVLRDEHHTPAPSFVVKPLSTVTFSIANGPTIFGGIVQNPRFQALSPQLTEWSLDCRDYTYWADSAIVHGTYVGDTADSVVKALTALANCGISTNHVMPAPTVSAVSLNYEQLSSAWQDLAKLASVNEDYAWFVDASGATPDLWFYGASQAPASGITFTDDVTGQPTDTLGFYKPDFAYEYDGSSIRNSCIVRGATYSGKRTDNWLGNGAATSWQLTYPLNSSTTNAAALTVGGVATQLTINTNSGTITTPYQLTQALNGQWSLVVTPGVGTAPGPGVLVSLAYSYQAPVVARYDDLASQRSIGGANGGVYQMYLNDTSITTLSTAMARAQAEAQQYGVPQERVTFVTTEGWPGYIRAGYTFTFQSQFVPDSENGYAAGISDTFMVVSNTVSGVQGNYRTQNIIAVRL